MGRVEKIKLGLGRMYEKFPEEVWMEGNGSLLAGKLACVVGSREASKAGLMRARQVSELLGKFGYTLVSGLAIGVDREVHETALRMGYPTVAVLPTAIDRVYPAVHESLARRIVDSGGLLISEHASGEVLQRWHFLSRNRLMVGISQLVVLVEAREKSGSTYSASCAAELGKDIYVFAGSRGCDLLLQEGVSGIEELYRRLAQMV